MTECTATYSPDDNKLRLYPSARLDTLTYERVRAAGFAWAPKQELFVAPMWTPDREEIALELAGQIDDEDTSLVERAAERAERFENYSEAREKDADRAHAAVHAIAGNIPFGQPILVGHHSERRARKDAQRIRDGMSRAVSMWATSEYWASRAAGAIRTAKYKERADVRARRIKGIEADLRKAQKITAEAEKFLAEWIRPDLTMKQALFLANYSHISHCFPLAEYPREAPISQYEGAMGIWSALDGGIITVDQARELTTAAYRRSIARQACWIGHYENRLTYERAMLGEQGGLVAENVEIAVGGRVLCRGEWLTVMRLNKKAGKLLSVSTNARYVKVRGVDEISQYEAPSAEAAAAVASATKKHPICNYPGPDFLPITQAQWDEVSADYKGTKTIEATATTGPHRARMMLGVYAGVNSSDMNKRHGYPFVYITDAKRKDPPAAEGVAPAAPAIPAPEPVLRRTAAPLHVAKEPNKFQVMADQLHAGVKVVSAPQLFPTPAPLAARMVEAAQIELGMDVLEPSAGTARILQALPFVVPFGDKRQTGLKVVAVEINQMLAGALERSGLATTVRCADFLECNGDLGTFDRILANPPFAGGADIRHIQHALTMLKPGGRMVAICANGPRQQEILMPLVDAHGGTWEVLPHGTFMASGTNVASVMLTLQT